MSAHARALVGLAAGLLATSSAWAGAQTNDIRDIRGPESIPHYWIWFFVSGGVVVLAAIAIALFKRRRRARRLSADARALARLDAAQTLAAAGQPREYAQAASDAIREYIEERFGMASSRATTEEFLQDLVAQTSSPVGAHRPSLEQFLAACDLAKFARYQLPPAGMASLNDLARQFVLTTRMADARTAAKESP